MSFFLKLLVVALNNPFCVLFVCNKKYCLIVCYYLLPLSYLIIVSDLEDLLLGICIAPMILLIFLCGLPKQVFTLVFFVLGMSGNMTHFFMKGNKYHRKWIKRLSPQTGLFGNDLCKQWLAILTWSTRGLRFTA